MIAGLKKFLENLLRFATNTILICAFEDRGVKTGRYLLLALIIAVAIFALLSGPAKADPNILQLETYYEYGWWVGHIQCLTKDPDMDEPDDYYTSQSKSDDRPATEQDIQDFQIGRADGCKEAVRQLDMIRGEQT